MQLIDKTFLTTVGIDVALEDLVQYGDMIMVASLETSSMKIEACNRYFAKQFRISMFESNKILFENILHNKEGQITPVISYPGEKPIVNIVYRHNDTSPINCLFYECNEGKSLLMYLQLQQSSDLDLIEKMSAVTTELAGTTLELRKKNRELQITRDAMVYQARMAATSDIIQMLAHQWRQPLSALSAMVGTMQIDNMMDCLSKDKVEDKLANMNKTLQELSSMIGELRGLYNNTTQSKQVTLSPLIEKAVLLLQTLLKDNGITVRTECPSEIISYGFEAELLQCFIGIMKNSIEAFEEGTTDLPLIKIMVQKEAQKVTVVIEDNAGGMNKEDLGRVFDPYFSTKSNTQRGLGLYMINVMITEKMQGEVFMENIQNGLRTTLVLSASI